MPATNNKLSDRLNPVWQAAPYELNWIGEGAVKDPWPFRFATLADSKAAMQALRNRDYAKLRALAVPMIVAGEE